MVHQRKLVEGADKSTTHHAKTDQPATTAFRFLRQPSRPNPTRPLTKSGSAAGSETGDSVPTSPEDIPTPAVLSPATNWSKVCGNPKKSGSAEVVKSTGTIAPTAQAARNVGSPDLEATVIVPKNVGLVVLSWMKFQWRVPVSESPSLPR